MSDENSSSPQGTVAAELRKILEEAQSQKVTLDAVIASTQSALTDGLAKTQEATNEIANAKAALVSAQAGLEADRATASRIVEVAKQAQQEIEGLKTTAATAKGGIEVLQQAAINDQAAIAQAKNDVETLKANASQLSQNLATQHNEITDRISELKSRADSLQTASQEIADLKTSAATSENEIRTFLDEVENVRDRFSNLNSSSGEQYEGLTKKQAELEAKISEINKAHEDILRLRKSLLETSEGQKSVQDEISELHEQINNILQETAQRRDEAAHSIETFFSTTNREIDIQKAEWMTSFKKLYDSLRAEILRLLPSAGAAGLAWTYYDAKARYAPTPVRRDISTPSEPISWWNVTFGYSPMTWVATIFFYILFMGPLLLLAWGTWDLIVQVEFHNKPIPDTRLIALRFLIAIPLATLSTFGFASLRLYRKLYEQYNHKQRVMELYMSFKKEIGENGDDEQKKKLLTVMLDSVAEKAWQINSPETEEKDDENILNLEKLADVLGKLKEKAGV